MFIKYEAEVSSRVGGGERGVVDFGKLFTETNEQKFSLELEDLQSSRKRFGLEHREGDLCWSRSESEGRIERAECRLHRGGGLGNKRK